MIGLIAISGKPITKGHWNLIETASSENEIVHLFISAGDRKNKNEAPVYGEDMKIIWEQILLNYIPKNVKFYFVVNPVKKIYETLNNNENFSIYGDQQDLNKNFPINSIEHHFPSKNIKLVPISRSETDNISGTKMRYYLNLNERQKFCSNLPVPLNEEDKGKIWEILKKRIVSENLIRNYVKFSI